LKGIRNPPVVHHQPVGLLLAARPVDAGNGLKEGMLPKRGVEVHHLLDGSIEARQQHVADD
jgi:hypothetical protein